MKIPKVGKTILHITISAILLGIALLIAIVLWMLNIVIDILKYITSKGWHCFHWLRRINNKIVSWI